MKTRRLWGLMLAVMTAFAAPAFAAGVIEEHETLPAQFAGRSVGLAALIQRPDDRARHPLMVLNHGSPRNTAERVNMTPSGMRTQALEFVRRGWVVVSFLRRGFGASGGDYGENYGSTCESANYVPAGRSAAADAREVIRLMQAKPYVDGAHVISVGQSAGGFATLALTAEAPPGLIAAINFAGGRGSLRPDEVCNPRALTAAFAAFGRTARIPTLWIYAENDHFFGPALARQFYSAYTQAGGRAEFFAAPAFGEDGHNLFTLRGEPIWGPVVDRFLARLNLAAPAAAAPAPAAVPVPPELGENGRATFHKYLNAPGHKAFALSNDGKFGWSTGRSSVDDATQGALGYCRQVATQPCRVVMVDDRPAR